MTSIKHFKKIARNLRYDKLTGLFWWTVAKNGRSLKKPAGFIRIDGYAIVRIDGVSIYGHRLAWYMATGNYPKFEIDHIDGNPENNKICNLRQAKHHENLKNAGPLRGNSSGYRGVDFRVSDGKFRARIRVPEGRINLGLFNTAIEAHCAYQNAAKNLHGKFRRDV